MKLIQISDLHLGKKVFGYDLMEEQKDALEQVVHQAKENQADAVLICGDIYDSATPPVYAVALLNDFLEQLHDLDVDVLMISGNHDSAGRLDFGSKILRESKIHIASIWSGQTKYVDLCKNGEKSGFICFHLFSQELSAPHLMQTNAKPIPRLCSSL